MSCSSSAERNQNIIPTSVHSAVDSLAQTVQNMDSLVYWTEYFIAKDDSYGEMVMRRALGEYYQSRSLYMNAIEQHNLSLVIAEKRRDTLEMIETLNLLGHSLRLLGVTGQSAEHHFRALRICDEWSQKDCELAQKCKIKSQMGIGNVQMTLGNFVRAEDAFRLALEGERKLNNPTGQAELYANLGKIQELKGQPDSAFIYYEHSLEMNRNVKSKLGIALCYNHFGRLAEQEKDLDAALRYYYRAYYIMNDEPARESVMESCLSMARVYMKRGEMGKSREYIEIGRRLAEQVRSWKMMAQACLLQSLYDEKMGNDKQALHWYRMSNAYNDSVTNERTQTFVAKIRQQYVSDRYNKELETLRMNYSEVKRNNRAFLAWAILAGVFALLCITFLLYMLRVRMRSQKMVQHMEMIRTDFFTNVTHEFRTPLTVMLGLAKQIENWNGGEDKEAFQKIGSMIARQGNSLLDLVNQLLDIAKAESAIGKAEWRTGDVAPYLSMIIENIQVYADQKNVSLAYAAERELVMDFVPDYLRKVLQNLLTNAIKYSGEGGKVTVRMEQKGKFMQLLVSDTGRGISEKDIPHIFDAFYTATNWGIEVSAGVGLAMVRQMVTAMHGSISVESKVGKGTTFTILLPLRQHDGKKFISMEESLRPQTEYIAGQYVDKADMPIDAISDAMKPLVLIIEDNRDVATYIGMQLTDKYRVAYAMNGKEGVARAMELLPELIVSDLMMPIMNGYEVCHEIRKSEALCHTPIIVVSAKSTETDKLKALEAGADAFLCKPFSAEELILLTSKLIRQQKLYQKKNQHDVDRAEPTTLKPHERDFLNKFVDVVYSQMPKGGIDAESLASVMCMSSSQLRRKIMAITGEKLTAYVLNIRLKHALKLLDTKSDMPVADVASRCGFEDAAYFSRIFKNVYQMTPSQYRKQGGLLDTNI